MFGFWKGELERTELGELSVCVKVLLNIFGEFNIVLQMKEVTEVSSVFSVLGRCCLIRNIRFRKIFERKHFKIFALLWLTKIGEKFSYLFSI